ncbi:hypothetical protein [Enterococcus faecalis]|uniref:hypothetical protein n=1 Tax=Enterococcus faecalis TaxID=1351 RepID=UPI002FBDC996
MKKYSKRLLCGLIGILLLGGNLVSSVEAYAETVSEEPKTGETTGGESLISSNGEKETTGYSATNVKSEDVSFNFLNKTVPEIIDMINYNQSSCLYLDKNGDPIESNLFKNSEKYNLMLGHRLVLAIPENAPIKSGENNCPRSY